MAETPEDNVLVPSTMAMTDVLHLEGDAVEKLAKLGAEATGVEIQIVEFDSGLPGLPTQFPIAIVHGESPRVEGLKKLAEDWRSSAGFRTGTARANTLESFIDLVNHHKDETSVVFVESDWRKPSMTAVLDYHPAAFDPATHRPANGKHRVGYTFPLDEVWKAWVEGDGKWMDQLEFAQMIEDRMAELGDPGSEDRKTIESLFQTTVASPAALITLSRGLQVNVEAAVKETRILQSGAGQVSFEENHKDADGKPLTVPGAFMLRIAPFFMGKPIEIPVRLRYRVRSGKIVWAYLIYRPDKAIGEAVQDAMAEVRERTGLPVYEGAPEMAATGAAA